jgi:hypothetical protein
MTQDPHLKDIERLRQNNPNSWKIKRMEWRLLDGSPGARRRVTPETWDPNSPWDIIEEWDGERGDYNTTYQNTSLRPYCCKEQRDMDNYHSQKCERYTVWATRLATIEKHEANERIIWAINTGFKDGSSIQFLYPSYGGWGDAWLRRTYISIHKKIPENVPLEHPHRFPQLGNQIITETLINDDPNQRKFVLGYNQLTGARFWPHGGLHDYDPKKALANLNYVCKKCRCHHTECRCALLQTN